MPVYNTAKYLDENILSIIHQTYTDWELIAVNDFSSDDTLEVLNKWATCDSRIKVYSNNSKGILPALKLAFSKAQGTWVTRMDSDDKMPVNKLELMMESWQPKSVVTGKVSYFSDKELGEGYQKYTHWINNVMDQKSFETEVFKECVIPSQNWLIHRDDFNELGAFDTLSYPEDYDLCFRFLQSNLKILPLNETLHFWRDREDRISRTGENYKDNRFFHLKVKYFLKWKLDKDKTLVLWGAGKNGKDLAKWWIKQDVQFTWVCENQNKIGHQIYDQTLAPTDGIFQIPNKQIVISVAGPKDKQNIAEILLNNGLKEGQDYWFFL